MVGMEDKFMFKVGDMVVIDYSSNRNRDGAYPSGDVHEITEVYVNNTVFVKIKGRSQSYFQERFKLAKNYIVTQILNDL